MSGTIFASSECVCVWEKVEKFRQICFLWHFPFVFPIQQWATIPLTKLWPGDALSMISGEVHDGSESGLRNISHVKCLDVNYCGEVASLSSFSADAAWCLRRDLWPPRRFALLTRLLTIFPFPHSPLVCRSSRQKKPVHTITASLGAKTRLHQARKRKFSVRFRGEGAGLSAWAALCLTNVF